MLSNQSPRWLNAAEKKFGYLAIPHLGLYLVILQAFGLLAISLKPEVIYRLILRPEKVFDGEIWRLFTFTTIPLADGLWALLAIYFLYFLMQTLEAEWGAFRATFYLMLSIVLSILYSFVTGMPISTFQYVQFSLFFAVAALNPHYEILLFFILPVKIVWIAFAYLFLLLIIFLFGDMYFRMYLLLVHSNYFLFFGKAHYEQFKAWQRRRQFKKNWRR